MEDRKILFIISALIVGFFVAAALLTRGGGSVLAQGDPSGPSGKESSAPLGGTAVGSATNMPEEEPIDPAQFGPNAPEALVDFRIAGSALRPRRNDVSYAAASGGGCLYATAGNHLTIFNAPLSLPRGSTVLAMRMYFDDTSSSDSRGWFSIYDLYGNIVQEWAVDSVGISGNGFNDTDAINHTIDYLSYSYLVNWLPNDLNSDTQLCGFRIFYEPPPFGVQFLPSVAKP